jgi:C-terminal processing protease CtpA/Prc
LLTVFSRGQGTARQSGLVKVGDLIHEVNDTNIYGMADQAVVAMIVGPPG